MKSPAICLMIMAWMLAACTQPVADSLPGDGCARPTRAHEPGKIGSISDEDFVLMQHQGGLLLIDSRDPWFYSQGRIPGALSLASGEGMGERIGDMRPKFKEAVEKGHPIIVYCNGFGCHDARTVCRAISKAGFDVIKFGGGWKAWKNFDLPIESASQELGDLSPQPES